MTSYKAFRFRVYLSPVQRARLEQWKSALRWLWNLANEQRWMGLSRANDDKVYVKYAQQNRELTALRAEYSWLADVPSDLCQAILIDLDHAWRRFFRSLGRPPRYKSRRNQSNIAFRCGPKGFRLDDAGVKQFPKLGRIRTILHRSIEGRPKTCALVAEGDQWFVSITCEIDREMPQPRSASSTIGVARDIEGFYALSDGHIEAAQPPNLPRTLATLARAKRTVARRSSGSKRKARAEQRVMRLVRRAQRQRAHTLHVESRRIAESQGIVVIEKSDVAGAPYVGWPKFLNLLSYKVPWAGGTLLEVVDDTARKRCSICGCVQNANPLNLQFACTKCGHTLPASVNAAANLRARGNPSCLHVDGV